MRTANIRYAREHLRHLIDEVSTGEEVILLRRGTAVARLIPIEREPEPLPSLESFRYSIRVQGRPLSEEIVSAREDERY